MVHVAHSFEEAEDWDLEYWQTKTPQERISALMAIRRDVEKIRETRRAAGLPDWDEEDQT